MAFWVYLVGFFGGYYYGLLKLDREVWDGNDNMTYWLVALVLGLTWPIAIPLMILTKCADYQLKKKSKGL